MSAGGAIVITGVRIVPAGGAGATGSVDVSIDESGRIAEIKQGIAVPAGGRRVSADGAYISPGWVDMHAHVYDGVSDIGLAPARIGLATGVHVLAEAGSAGEANFEGLKRYVIQPSATRIVPFLNLGSTGLVKTNKVSELSTWEDVDLEGIARCIDANRALIKAIKVRSSGVIVRDWGIQPLLIGREVARPYRLPLVVHVGEPLPFLEQMLEVLGPGDVLTHCFHGKRGGCIPDTRDGFRLVAEAQRNGLVLDLGHGAASFDFGVAERALEAGIVPDTFGTDLHARSIGKGVWDLCTTMTKMLDLGVSLDRVIRGVTERAASFLGLETCRRVEVGAPADLTLFRVIDCDLPTTDSVGNVRRARQFILPLLTFRGTDVRPARPNNPAVAPFITNAMAPRVE